MTSAQAAELRARLTDLQVQVTKLYQRAGREPWKTRHHADIRELEGVIATVKAELAAAPAADLAGH